MAKKKSIYNKMDDFFTKNQKTQQMTNIQHNDVSTYDKPNLFSQMDEMLKPKDKPKNDYVSRRPELLKKRKEEEEKKKSTPKKSASFSDNLKGFLKGEKVLEGLHFRDIKKEDSDTTINKVGKLRPNEKGTEVDRFIAQASNSASFGLPKELAKRTGDKHTLDSFYNERKIGEGGGKDLIAQGLGYLVPGIGIVKGVKAVGLGAKEGTKGLAKLGQIAKEGLFAGGALSAAEVGIREGINPNDYNWKQNAGHIGVGMGTGAVADPLLHGAGKLIGKSLPKKKVELLGLPEPQKLLEAPQKQSIKEAFERDGLNFGFNTKNAPKSRPLKPLETKVDSRPSEYWQQRYEDFANHVNNNYDKNNLSPEALDDLWSQFAKYDEPYKLDQVVDLAYPKGFNSAPTPKVESQPKLPIIKNEPELFQTPRPLEFRTDKYINPNVQAKPKEQPKFENISPKNDDPGLISKTTGTNEKELQNIKDISQLQVGTTDLYRLSDKLPKPMKEHITGSLDKAKKSNIEHQQQLTDDLYEKVVKGLGIKKGSKDSALVQDYGEKTLVKRYLKKRGIDPSKLSDEELDRINLQQLKKNYPDKWEKIVKADQYFRESYEKLLDQVNEVRRKLYPRASEDNEKIVPKRKDYYHHFNELSGFEGFKNLFDTPANIDPHLEGVSPFTKPKAKFQGYMQKRGNGEYTSDAVGGYLKYLQASSHSINIDPVIPVLRKSANEIADATTDTRNANKIIEALQDHANDLAGKTNPYDRVTQKIINRKGMALLNWANSRVKSNMILGNLGSVLGQLGNIPLGVGKVKQHAFKGLTDTIDQTIKEVIKKDTKLPIHQSTFLKERFSDGLYRRFDQSFLDQPKKFAVWMMETTDKAATRFIWNSMYNKGLKQGVKDPVKFADYETRNVIAGRGVGEVPLLQKSKTVQILAPFTLEVGNQWKVLKEMVGEKDAVGIITTIVASYGLNKVMEEIRGSGVSFDPIDAIIEGYSETEGNKLDKTIGASGYLAGEVIGNIPGGNLITNATIADKKIPFTEKRFQEYFGDRNPNRFGSGLTLSKPIQDPLYGLLPFGASQVRKTTGGFEASKNEGVYKDNPFIPFTGDKKELKFPVETNPLKKLQMVGFGPNSTKDAKEYYNNKRQPLDEIKTKAYEIMKREGVGKELYDYLRVADTKPYDKSKITKIMKDEKFGEGAKAQKILEILGENKK